MPASSLLLGIQAEGRAALLVARAAARLLLADQAAAVAAVGLLRNPLHEAELAGGDGRVRRAHVGSLRVRRGGRVLDVLHQHTSALAQRVLADVAAVSDGVAGHLGSDVGGNFVDKNK